MDYRKLFKFISIALIVLITIFTIVYYAAITRADESPLENEDGIESASLNKVLGTIKDFFEKESSKNSFNTATINDTLTSKKEVTSLDKSKSNREMLDKCLARAENEWAELQFHYDQVLSDCISLNLGMNGGKLFEVQECESQIVPTKENDKIRIQSDKEKCFLEYSERQ